MKQFLFRLSTTPLIVISLISGFAISAAANAATIPSLLQGGSVSTLGTNLFCPIQAWMFWILISIAVIMVMWAAYLYLTAGDDPQQVQKATKTMTYAAVAVVVALIAEGFPVLISSIFPATSSGISSPLNCSGS
jgi:type III secretory pathway component EscV